MALNTKEDLQLFIDCLPDNVILTKDNWSTIATVKYVTKDCNTCKVSFD